ncbi:MAG: D-alanyl-D-alanine carboxypeptidase/D-alanyl-D-alanine-endopeptidase [Bacteroidetes bacterium]|nr:D-alanyl-D-alanine carboxypeptidase/D-alanyl-D-alanine-endopeptidase [Bacteroidota bacterium]HET6245241.1 D-alanyl-D-alanine carboxypeptidase/D-alanyl-D-alanine-endopeptidase [Bacteroidia bacterium]
MRIIFVISVIFLFVISPLLSQQSKDNLLNKQLVLQQLVNKTGADKDLKNGSFGFYAIDTKTGTVLIEYNSNQSLIPASTMKAVTTAASLELFGSKHRFKTTLEYDGYIDSECVLQGNLYIKGGGDPSIGSSFLFNKNRFEFLTSWTNAVFASGISGINGSIVGDDEIFSGELIPSTWTWGDIGNYYGACSSGLSVFDNVYEIEFSSGNIGDLVKVKNILPFIPYMQLKSEVKASSVSSDNSIIFGAPNSPHRIIRGEIPSGRTSFFVKGAMPEPPLLAAFAFNEVLKKNGMKISGEPSTINRINTNSKRQKRIQIADFYSPFLIEIINWTNLKSVNLFAEHLLNHIGLLKLKSGESQAGAKALTEFWRSKGIDTQGMFIADGSGLSRANGITAKQLAEVMKYMTGSSEFEFFYNSLAIAGISGSIANICQGTSAGNNLRAKSGYINRVRSYTGYVNNKSGNLIAFAMIANNYTCSPAEMKSKMEKIMVAMSESNCD